MFRDSQERGPDDSRAQAVRRRKRARRLVVAVLAAATAFCGWGVVDEWSYSRDVAAHYGRASGTVVRDSSSPSGLSVDWQDRDGQSQQYELSRAERSDLSLRQGDRTEVRYDDTGDVFLQAEDGPAPWIPAVLALVTGALLMLVWRRGGTWVNAVVALPYDIVLLRTLPGAKAAYLHVNSRNIELVLPRYFGTHRWRLAVGDVAVLRDDVSELADLGSDGAAGPVFARPVVVPYLPTGIAVTSPNLVLLFARPLPFPALKRSFAIPGATRDLPFSYREIKRGVTIDGLELRAVNPSDAKAYLGTNGVAVVDDPDAWLATHRELVHDEKQRAALIAHDEKVSRWSRRVGWLSGTSFAVLLVARVLGNVDSNAWFAVVAVAVAAVLVVPFAVERMLRRSDPNR